MQFFPGNTLIFILFVQTCPPVQMRLATAFVVFAADNHLRTNFIACCKKETRDRLAAGFFQAKIAYWMPSGVATSAVPWLSKQVTSML